VDVQKLDLLTNLVHALLGRLKELTGVMLDPTGLLVNLGEFLLMDSDDFTLSVEKNETGRGSTLVKSSDVLLRHF